MKMQNKIIEDENKFIFPPASNTKMKFLVLIKEDDQNTKRYFFCKKSIKANLNYYKNYLPGDIDIINFDDIDKEPNTTNFLIDSDPLPNEMYIKLIPINLYISTEHYQLRNFLLRQNELKNIFIALGAKKIKWSFSQETKYANEINCNFGVNINEVNVEEEVGMSNSSNIKNKEFNKMEFGYNKKTEELNYDSFNNKKYYFLPKEYEWQNIIIRRLEDKLEKDKYTFTNSSSINFKASLKSKLEIINIGFNYSNDDLNNLNISYEIDYHPLNNNNFSKKDNKFKEKNNKVDEIDNDKVENDEIENDKVEIDKVEIDEVKNDKVEIDKINKN